MATTTCDVAVIGGGIVGTATAMALTRAAGHLGDDPGGRARAGRPPDRAQQRRHSLGALLQARLAQGDQLRRGAGGDVPFLRRARHRPRAVRQAGGGHVFPAKIAALDELERRGRANGLKGLRRLDGGGAARRRAVGRPASPGLRVEETGIVDYTAVTEAFARLVQEAGGDVRLGCARRGGQAAAGRPACWSPPGATWCARHLINCAGLQSDRVARMCGVEPGLTITPFRGEYYELVAERQHLVRNLIYPVPDPQFPFLGVHFTRMIDGGVEAGPNAVLAFRREGYTRTGFSLRRLGRDGRPSAGSGGWRRRHWRMGLHEMYRSFSKAAFVRALQKLDPRASRRRHPPGRGRRARPGARALRRAGGRLPDRRGRAA